MKHVIANHSLKNILIIFLLPLVLSVMLYLFSSYHTISASKANINEQFINQLYNFIALNKELTNNVFQDFLNMESFTPIASILRSDSVPQECDTNISDAQTVLRLCMQNNSIINGICLVNRHSGFVVTENELYLLENFFDFNCSYSQYDFAYWNELHIRPNNPKLLNSGEVTVSGQRKFLIPYVFTIPDTINNSSYIIVNLDVEYIFQMFMSYEYTPNTQFFLMNNATTNCLSANGTVDFPFEDTGLKSRILRNNFSTYNNIRIDHVKYYVLAASSTNSLYNYSYIVCVPNHDITNSTSAEKSAFFVTLLLEILIMAISLFVFITKIYRPLSYISMLTSKESGNNQNLLSSIINHIQVLSDNISSLEGTLNEMLPVSVQTYLNSLIRNNIVRDPALEKAAFKHNYFIPLSIEIIFRQKFYEDINMPYLSSQAIDIINTQFEIKFHTYCISKSPTTLSILINLPNESEIESVRETIKTTLDLFSADSIYLTIYIGTGSLISDLSLLGASFHQCIEQIHSALTDEKKNIANASAIFGYKENTQLENYLTYVNTDAALALLTFTNQKLLSASRDVVTTVYIDILLSIHRVMKLKGIPSVYLNNFGDLNFMSEIEHKALNELYEYAVQCIKEIDHSTNKSGNVIDMESIVQYIRLHFAEDLSLDALAEKYCTTPQYLSKRIKQYLGINFLDYLSSLRIEKAKELLASGSKGINEIFEECGFISRNTFLRVFKKYTGVSPSEYRKNAKGNSDCVNSTNKQNKPSDLTTNS